MRATRRKVLSARTTYAVLYFLQGASSMEVATSCSPAIKRKDGRLCRAQSENTRSSSSGGSGVKDKMFRVLVDPPPTGTFFAGSEITGCVQVETQEEKKFKYIHVSLTGRAQVWWVDRSSLREYGAEKEYLHETQMLWTRDDHGLELFPAGLHSFPFHFSLPSNIPSSFEGRVGWVRYELFARIVTGIIKKEHTIKIDVPVMEVVDINRHPLLLKPTTIRVQKRVWNFPCTFRDVCLSVNLSRTGFCVGEEIPLKITLDNCSCYEVTMTAILRQMITYTATKQARTQFDKAVVGRVVSHQIAQHTSIIWPINFRVPLEEAPSQNYQPIDIAYSIKVIAAVAWQQTLVAKIPITIGNIPYGESLVNTDTHDHTQLRPHHSPITSQTEMMSSLPHSPSSDDVITTPVHDAVDSGEPSDICLATS